jgi:hypothetical protein
MNCFLKLALSLACFAAVVICDGDSDEFGLGGGTGGGFHGLGGGFPGVGGGVYGAPIRPRPVQRPVVISRPSRPSYGGIGGGIGGGISGHRSGGSRRGSGGYGGGSDSYAEVPRYNFAYQLAAGSAGGAGGYGGGHSGQVQEFGHTEGRDGDKTQGKYFVQLPDGRLQTVEYYVTGDSGYVAKVTYSGGESAGRGYGAGAGIGAGIGGGIGGGSDSAQVY